MTIATPVPTRAKATMRRPAAIVSPQSTPNTAADRTTMNRPRTMAPAKRPTGSPGRPNVPRPPRQCPLDAARRDQRRVERRIAPLSCEAGCPDPGRLLRDRGRDPLAQGGEQAGLLAEDGDRGRTARPQRHVVSGRDHEADLEHASLDAVAQLGRGRHLEDLQAQVAGSEGRLQVHGQRSAVAGHDPQARCDPPPVDRTQHDDEDDRQQEHEEEAGPVAKHAQQVDPRDGQGGHRASTTLRARSSPRPPLPSPIAVSTASDETTASTPAPEARSFTPRRNQACGVKRLSCARPSGAWDMGKNEPPSTASVMATIAVRPPAWSSFFAKPTTSSAMPLAASEIDRRPAMVRMVVRLLLSVCGLVRQATMPIDT